MVEILFLVSLNLLNVLSETPLPACHEKMCDFFSGPVNSQLVKESYGWIPSTSASTGDPGGYCEASCSNPERKLRCFYTYDEALRPDDIQRGIWVCEKPSTVKAGEKCNGFTVDCEDGFKCSKDTCVEKTAQNDTKPQKGEFCGGLRTIKKCDEGLECRVRNSTGILGTCAVPSDNDPPFEGTPCGDLQCAKGLNCEKITCASFEIGCEPIMHCTERKTAYRLLRPADKPKKESLNKFRLVCNDAD